MEVNQITHTTMFNRHPELFTEVREIIGDNKKILSFGCSTGEEVKTLKELYFRNSQIDGYDINEKIISDIKYRTDIPSDSTFFNSLENVPEESYDIIFCLSVLTRSPDPYNTYSFELFENTLDKIHKYVKPNGYICIWNSRFEFTDTVLSKKYTPICTNWKDSGSTQKYYKDFKREKESSYPYILFQKISKTYLNSIDEHITKLHVSNAILKSKIHDKPAPYIFVEDVFPDDVYESIFENQKKAKSFYKEQIHTGDPKIFFGSYDTRLQLYIPEDLKGSETLQFFQQLKNVLSSDEVFNSLYIKFKEGFTGRFGSLQPKNIKELTNPTLLLTKHEKGYYLGTHTDRKEKVITCVFYFPERDDLEYLGTAMYEPKEKGFTCKGVVHHNPEKFIYTHTVPCKKNSVLIFFRDDRLFHGVEKLTGEEDSERFNIQFNLWLPWGSDM